MSCQGGILCNEVFFDMGLPRSSEGCRLRLGVNKNLNFGILDDIEALFPTRCSWSMSQLNFDIEKVFFLLKLRG
jgi:hypothetical protein